MVQEKKIKALEIEMQRLGVFEGDLEESFVLGSSKGGQKAQKTHNSVNLLHVTTGVRVTCHDEREREVNRYKARVKLCDKIQALRGEKTKKDLKLEKIKKQKKRRTRRHNKGLE